MYDPISVSTALVSSGGDLLIELTDGTIINAGRVRGNPGPQGERGEQGIRGAHGKDGTDGTNGAKWHTGVGAPEIGLGEDGDLYMDVASSLLPIFQKVGGDWLFLSNLKPTSSGGVGATGEGAAGGGSSIIIKPGPTPPINDNDGNSVDIGDLWWDSTTGLIYVNTINGWIAISDHPPAIVSPTPPDFTNNSDPTDPNKRYPVREGDLWFDSAQAALYVAALNGDGDLVWVISTPADRSILQEEIPIGGFIFPAATQDGDTVFNDVTGLWYVYNGAKNQWIDLPPGERELSYPGILREADPAIDETYEGEANAADGDVYLNSSDHEAGTRLVVRKVDRKGFAWTDFIQGIAEGDGIALVQTNYDNGPDNPQTQRVDYLIVTSIVENPDSFSIEVDYEQQNFDHDPLFDEEVSVRFLAQVSSPAVCVTFQEATPEPKCVGHLWFDSSEDDYTLYLYDGNEWVPAAPPVSLEGIEQSIYHISEKLSVVETGVVGARVDIAGNAGEIEAAKVRLEDLETSQTVQDNQIIELEEEIESLAPSLDRGKWNLAQLGENVTLASGEYAMGIGANRVYCEEQYEQCLLAIGGNPNDDPAALAECNRIAGVCFNAADGNGEYYMNDWSHATFLHFHKTDSEGKNHTFSDYKVGMFIDLFDQGDTGFAVFEITAAPTLDGDVYTIGVTPVQHEGEASGLARIKVFELAGADPTDFVRKTGDTMTGSLNLLADTYDETSVSYPKIIFKAPDAEGDEQFSRIYQKGAYLRSDRSFQSGGSFNATGNLQYNGITRVGMSSGDNYLGVGTTTAKRAFVWNSYGHATKIQTSSGYGQEGQALTVGPNQTLQWATPTAGQPKPGPFTWKFEKRTSGTASPGYLWWKDKFVYLSSTTAEGAKLAVASALSTGATTFSSYHLGSGITNSAANFKFWRLNSSGAWELTAWAIPYKYRFGYGGWVQLEYASKQGSLPEVEDSLWCITLPDLI